MSDDFSGVMESMASAGDSVESPSTAEDSGASGASAPLAESSASATTTPTEEVATATQQTASPVESQMVPYQRFREVNEERTRFKQSLDRLQWASAIPDTAQPVVAQFYQELTRDPIGTLLREVEGLMESDPTHAQAVRSAAARWMGAGRGVAADAMPEPDLQAQDGTLVYSASQAQKLMDWREQRIQKQVSEQFQPLQQWAQQQQVAQVRSEIDARATKWASDTYAQWSARPHFAEHKQEIADLMEQRGYGIADAYADVLQTKVFPTLQHHTTSAVVASLQQKAAAGTANPSRGPAQGAPTASTFGEALAQLTSAG